MTELAQKELKEQEKRAIEMGGYLRSFALTYDLTNDRERHLFKLAAEGYVEEQTKYEYMKLQAAGNSIFSPDPLHMRGEGEMTGAAA